MRITAILAAAICLTSAAPAAVKPVAPFSEPSISPDHSEIAFVSGGDIWTVPAKGGEARLLVAHPATESRPLYSPDGKQLAFNSTRTGNGDVYVLTFATGDVRRITYSDATENLSGWSRDGQWLYFDTNSNEINQAADIFRVRATGGTPLEVARDLFYGEFRGAPSPDGSEIAFVTKGFSNLQWWRHGHSHLDESEIWLKGIAEGSAYKQLVVEDAKQGWPMWSAEGRDLFYTSDRTGAENLFRLAVNGGTSKQITRFEDGRLLWPSISLDGREIVFERNFAIWKLDTKSGVTAEIPIVLRGASSTPAVTHLVLTQFTGLALSPDGKKVALLAHGDVFAASASDGGDAQRITHTAAPEADVHWEANSSRVVYVSTRHGHGQIFEYDLTKNVEQQLTSAEDDDAGIALSPDGKALAFVRGDSSLHVLNLQTKADRQIASGDLQEPVLSWSPDSQFLAYTSFGAKSFRNVNVVGVNGGIGQPVSFLANGESATRIAWSPDGKYLLFDTAQRSEPSQLARVDMVPHLPKLREEQFRELFRDKEPATPEQPVTRPLQKPQTKPDADATAAPTESKEEKGNKKPEPTRVVFEGIRQRLGFLAIGLDATSPVISPDGKTVVFLATTGNQRNLYSYSLDELAAEPATARQLTSTSTPKSTPFFTADSKTVFFLDGGRVTSMPVETHIPKPIAITAALDVDFDADKQAAFEQGWSILNKRYYDPKFHGQDWSKLRERYAPFIAGSRTPDEMRRVINLMIGELNSSHSGIGLPPGTANATPFDPAPTPVGRLGLRFERETYEAGKGLIVREVIPLSPAALDGHIKAGDRLRSVDGEMVAPDVNLDSLLQDKVNRRVVLQVAGADTGKTQEVVVRPVSFATEAGLLYRSWVENNRAYVERASGGKLGYVHIRDMSEQSLNQLYIDLDTQNQTRQGVVIDVRDNNGGFVNEYALDVFTRKNYLTMTPRGSKPAPARPYLGQRALGLPTVLVTNQGSLSDAEDFTEGYRALHLGKVVGEPTAGWIIYTGGAPLIDGSVIRTPMIRVQAADGQEMEMHPRPVDVLVERKAGEWLEGKDTQLDRAVKELLTSFNEHP